MAIIKSKHAGDYTVIPNDIVRSKMSLEAKGLLMVLLSHKSDWVIYKTTLHTMLDIGRDKLDRIFKELQTNGYIMSVQKFNDENGKFEYEHIVYDKPFNGEPSTGLPSTGLPYTGFPLTANPQLINTNIVSTNIVSTNTVKEKEIYKEKESGHTYKEYVDYINSKTGKRYRGDSTSSKSFGVRLKKYTFEELKSVVDNATQDEYHKGNNFMYLTPEFLLRETKIEKFLNSQSKPIGLTEEEKGRLQRLDQYHQFDGKDYMVEKGIWEEYQDLKKRYAVHTNK